jgi:hypothetical protein
MPKLLARPERRSARAAGRHYDAAARRVGDLVFGLGAWHPLLRDADSRLAAMREVLDRYPMRALGDAERRALGIVAPHAVFAADIRPLKRPATAEDVRAGRAVFHLGDDAKLAPGWKLPAVATWRPPAGLARRVLVVQAEIGPSRSVRCGIIAPDQIVAVSTAELTDVRPLP